MAAQLGDEENSIQYPLLDHADNGNAIAGEGTLNSEQEEEEEEEELPDVPLEPYKSYAKFTCRAVKWFLPFCILNIVLEIIWEQMLYRRPWRKSFNAGCFVFNAVFFFFAARAVDRDVAKVDEEFQTQVESGNENPPMDWNNYENIYGKVARKIDVWLISTSRSSTVEQPTGTTSFLSHLCWLTWAFFFANAFALTLDLPFQEKVPVVVDEVIFSVANTSSIFSNISHFPGDVQSWIGESYNTIPFDFPTSEGRSNQFQHPMLDDREFLPNDLWRPDDLWVSQDDDLSPIGEKPEYGLTELVAVGNRLERRVHRDVSLAHLFIPVQNSMKKNESWHSSQFCFLSQADDSKPRELNSCQDDKVHCVDSSKMENGKELILNNATLDWHVTKEMRGGNNCHSRTFTVTSASYKDLVFFKKLSRYPRCSEVIQINPATMETSTIYHLKCQSPRRPEDEYNGYNYRHRNYLRFSFGICGLLLTAYFLIMNMGMVSGVVPLALALGCIIFVISNDTCWIIFLTAATGFLHYSIFTDWRWRHLPVWVKEMYIWTLYGVLGAAILPLKFMPIRRYAMQDLTFLYTFLSGILLGHPVLQIFGCFFLIGGVYQVILDFEFLLDEPEESLGGIFAGLGLLYFGNWLSAHQEVIYSRARFVVRYLIIWFRCRRYFRRRSGRESR